MRKHLLRLGSALVMLLGVASVAGVPSIARAQGPFPGSGWYTSASIQNVSPTSAQANVTLEVFPQAGGTPSTATFNIDGGGSKTFIPGSGGVNGNVDVSPALPSNFAGASVISSNEPLVAIGQFTNFTPIGIPVGVQGGYASGQFRGSEARSSTLFYPTVKSNYNGKTTIFSIQSANSTGSVNYTATINANDGTTHTASGTLAANGSAYLIPSAFTPPVASTSCGTDANISPCFGSLQVVATGGNIVGTYVEFNDGQSPGTVAQATALFAATDASTTVLCPTVKNDYVNRRTTGITVVNTTSSAVTVDVTFTVSKILEAGAVRNPTASDTTTFTQNDVSIPGNRSVTFISFSSNIGGMPTGRLASAVVTSSAPNSIVAVVSESNFGTTPVKSTVYSCFNPSSATQTAAAPVVKRGFAGNSTGLVVQNANATGGASFQANLTLVCTTVAGGQTTTGTYTFQTASIAPGAGVDVFLPTLVTSPQIPSSSNCAVSTSAGAGNDVVVIVNESSDFDNNAVTRPLDTKNYEGFNL